MKKIKLCATLLLSVSCLMSMAACTGKKGAMPQNTPNQRQTAPYEQTETEGPHDQNGRKKPHERPHGRGRSGNERRNCPDGNCPKKKECPDGNCPDKQECPGGNCPDKQECPGGNCPDKQECPDGNCPDKQECPDGNCPDNDATGTDGTPRSNSDKLKPIEPKLPAHSRRIPRRKLPVHPIPAPAPQPTV